MSEKNQYFPNLFEPLKIGSKTVKNRIEAAPAMFAFEHFMEGDDPFGYTQPVNEKAYRMLEAKAKGGAGIVCLGEISPNHEYDKRFPFEPYVDYNSRDDRIFNIIQKTAEMIKVMELFQLGNYFLVERLKQISEMGSILKDHLRKIFLMEHMSMHLQKKKS